jgi:hypothetical protein
MRSTAASRAERVHYVRDGQPYDVDCKEYCDGTCDEAARACACPA